MVVEDVSKLITDDNKLDFSHDFIITRDSCYLGIGHIKDLLKVITDLQIKYARYANPLTGLPGNVPIYETIDRLLQDRSNFHVAYCDLDHFKPFNDVYGYSRGDRIIQNVADILSQDIDQDLDFVGHIGGDDFVVIFQSEDWQQRCNKMLNDFKQSVVRHYDREHVMRGGIVTMDRRGVETRYPLLSLSVGCVHPDPATCLSHHAVASLATEAKIMAKKMDGNALFVDNRRTPQQGSDLPLHHDIQG
jgi:diguanylate cyclase (GGDEF)-like protein